MNCGEEIRVKDHWGSVRFRFIAQCENRFMVISNSLDHLNGYMLPDWHQVLRELVAVTAPGKLIDKVHVAESSPAGRYVNIPLTYPLSAKGLADLLGVPADEVREQLADLAVEVD